MDHLKGKVFVEYLSQLKQQRIRAKLAKQLRKISLIAPSCASSLPARPSSPSARWRALLRRRA